MLNYLTQPQPTRGTTAVRYIGRTSTNTGSATYTFSNVNLGSASGTSSGLLVIVVEVHDVTTTTFRINSCTVGGLSTTLGIRITNNILMQNAIFYINWTSHATTANIVVTPSTTTTDGASIAIYRLDNISNIIPLQTLANAGSTNPYSWTFTGLSVGDLVIAATCSEENTTVTWTGLTENYDVVYDSLNLVSGASTRITTSGNTTFTRRKAQNIGGLTSTVSAVWR